MAVCLGHAPTQISRLVCSSAAGHVYTRVLYGAAGKSPANHMLTNSAGSTKMLLMVTVSHTCTAIVHVCMATHVTPHVLYNVHVQRGCSEIG